MEADDIKAFGREAEKFVNHPRLLSVPPAAAWLWVRGIVLAMQNHGTIPEAAVKRLKATASATQLVHAYLWRKDAGGYRMISLSAVVPAAPAFERQVARPTGPVLLEFPVSGSDELWPLTAGQVASLKQAFPGLDVLAECLKGRAWLEANHRKTAKGMPRFLFNWMTKANDARRGRGAETTPALPAGKYAGSHMSEDERVP